MIFSITWLEVIYGAPSKLVQASTKAVLNRSDMVYLTQADMDWAMRQLLTYHLSHGIAIMDCFGPFLFASSPLYP